MLRRQAGVALIGTSLAVTALGLPGWPLVAWLASVALNVCAVALVLRELARMVPARMPFLCAVGAAMLTGASVLAPTIAGRPVGPGLTASIACGAFLAAFLLWLEEFERPVTP